MTVGTARRVRRASDRALLVECEDLAETMALHAALEAESEAYRITEMIPGASTILVSFAPGTTTAEELGERIAAVAPRALTEGTGRTVEIPVHYDGEDLAELSSLMATSTEEIIRRHSAATWRVGFSGFAPGFGYLVCDDPFFSVPRRASPRTRVPAGSVALAGHFTGVYPRESPGGWQLIGRTDEVMWDLHRDPPALFAPGTVVHFSPAAHDQVLLNGGTREARPAPLHPDRHLTVLECRLPLLIQDLGRPGHAALGVAPSGAADRMALRTANRSVGNAAGAPALEIAHGGATVRFNNAVIGAVTGADAPLTLTETGACGASRSIANGRPFAIPAGATLQFGTPTRGVRSVLAVRGGLAPELALGSAATDTLAGLGPQPLTAGSSVSLGDPNLAPEPVRVLPQGPMLLRGSGETVVLDVTLGPRDDWFTPAAVTTLLTQTWEVTPRSDRVGIRLAGAVPLERARTGELPSEGAVTGAIQVPPEGQPVLFLPDHPLTGGYPIIGAVTDRSLDMVAQLPPGVRVRFRLA